MYLTWAEKTITDFSDININSLYNEGYLFTREGRGAMYQTRSLRIDLDKFELSSENRRILKKSENLQLTTYNLPLTDYDWKIGKMAKDFYETKFGKGTFSANKVKELLTTKHNFNLLLRYSDIKILDIGYCVCYTNHKILHYCYPFYQISPDKVRDPVFHRDNIPISQYPNIGMPMMLRAIIYAKEAGKKYVYLGSAKDAKAKYKLQFDGLEWFDGKKWKNDVDELKQQIKQ